MPSDKTTASTLLHKKDKKETRLEALKRLLFSSSAEKGEGKKAMDAAKEPKIGRGGKYIE